MYGVSSFNSFTPQFSSVYEPVTPICSLNTMLISSGLPTGWVLQSGTVNFATDGIRKYMNYPAGGVGFLTTSATKTYYTGTNSGASSVFVIRFNNLGPISSIALSGKVSSSTLDPLTTYLFFNSYVMSQGGSFKGIPPSILSGRNQFVCVVYTWNKTSGSCYLNGVNIGTNTITAQTSKTFVDGASKFTVKNALSTTTANFDVIYYGAYDVELSQNQVSRIYNSVAPLLDLGAPAPQITFSSTFTSFTAPTSPIVQFSVYDYALTNGATFSSWNNSGVQPMNMSVDGQGRKFLSFYTVGSSITKNFTVNTQLYTNQASTVAMVMRINQSSNELSNPLALFNLSGINTFYLSYPYPFGSCSKLFGFDATDGQTAGDAYAPPVNTVSNYIGRFALFVYIWNGTYSALYINNVFIGQAHLGSGFNSSGDKTSFLTSCQIGLINQNLMGANSVDITYAGFWDRAINASEMNTLYTSCNMLLDLGATAPIQSS